MGADSELWFYIGTCVSNMKHAYRKNTFFPPKVPIPSNFVLKIKIHFFNLSFENKTYTEIISDYLCTREKSVDSDTTSKKYQRQREKELGKGMLRYLKKLYIYIHV